MKCPFCGNEETSVKDTRLCDNSDAIKRKRICLNCNAKFYTVERILEKEIFVIKNDGRKVLFDIDKIISSIEKSSWKRLEHSKVEEIANEIYQKLNINGIVEVQSSDIGELVMDSLKKIDKVALIRYASVYMKFNTPKDFNNFIKKIDL